MEKCLLQDLSNVSLISINLRVMYSQSTLKSRTHSTQKLMHTYTIAATTLDSILCVAHIYHVILASYDKQLNDKMIYTNGDKQKYVNNYST